MTTDLIRYDLLVQEALKSVVRRVLTDTIRDGLPGDHHFYVSFRTDRGGVRISPRLRERYPQDMTIVLQHQFDRLTVTDQAFEVGLSFSGVPERLRVPFDALTGFFDPSVQFGLKFEVTEAEATKTEATRTGIGPEGLDTVAKLPSSTSVPAIGAPAPRLGSRKLEPVGDGDTPPPKKGSRKSKAAGVQPADEPSAEVVSLDAFRKKS